MALGAEACERERCGGGFPVTSRPLLVAGYTGSRSELGFSWALSEEAAARPTGRRAGVALRMRDVSPLYCTPAHLHIITCHPPNVPV